MRAVLTYHSIDDSGSPISVRRDAFQRHVKWLASGQVAVAPDLAAACRRVLGSWSLGSRSVRR